MDRVERYRRATARHVSTGAVQNANTLRMQGNIVQPVGAL